MQQIIIKYILLSALSLFYIHVLFSQGQNNIWCFGNHAGLDFNGPNVSSIQSQVQTVSNTASVSDPQGNLLFYTDGRTVWDRNHHIMPNGAGLKGGQYTTNPVLVTPFPQSDSKYYIFTIEDRFADFALRYSILDMSLNAGFGDVLALHKNILVMDSVAAGITSILHQNGSDIWIVGHKLNSTNYLSYLLNGNGLSPVPVISSIGSTITEDQLGGYIKTSSDYKKLLHSRRRDLEMFSFNSADGKLSGYIDLEPLFVGVDEFDDIAFSPNDSLIYVVTFTEGSSYSRLFQLVLATSQTTLLNLNPFSFFGSLQLASNNKIYSTNPTQPNLAVIQFPNLVGTECQFEEHGIDLHPGTLCLAGLPLPILYSFPLDSSDLPGLGRDTFLCYGDSILLKPNVPVNCDSIRYWWSNGSQSSQLAVSTPGAYWVVITSDCGTYIDTVQIDFGPCDALVEYNLEGCSSNMNTGTNMDYSEFAPEYPIDLNCAGLNATNVFRTPPTENKHSCTPGVNGSTAMCISSSPSCSYEEGSAASLIFEISFQPGLDSIVKLTSIEFYERSPLIYDWIQGSSGLNNYPQKFGVRILKNGNLIFKQAEIVSQREWTFVKFSFGSDTAFTIRENTSLRFEILPYCPIGNSSQVSAWDIDAIRISGGCVRDLKANQVSGHIQSVTGHYMQGVEVQLSPDSLFRNYLVDYTDSTGYYQFNNLAAGQSYCIRGFKNDDVLQGVNLLDALDIQKYLLGKSRFNGYDQYIAADINHSDRISVMDLVSLQQVMLGKLRHFPNNLSWRFISLQDAVDPIELSEFQDYTRFTIDSFENLQLDMIGVKIGDVNRDVQID